MAPGFLPCFSEYKHKEFPLNNLYSTNSHVEKVKNLLSKMVDSINPKDFVPGKDIQPIRKDTPEEKKIIQLCATPNQVYRIDYGNNPFRIVFGISNQDRMAYIYIIDTNHTTLRPKGRKQR